RTHTTQARDALTQIDSVIAETWAQLRRTRDPLVIFAPPELGGTDLAADWDAMVSWGSAQAADRSARIEAQQQIVGQAGTDQSSEVTALTGDLATHGIDVPEALTPEQIADRVPVLVADKVATARAHRERARERLEQAKQLDADIASAKETGDVSGMLSNLMKSNNFPRWLIAGAFDTLLRDASRI